MAAVVEAGFLEPAEPLAIACAVTQVVQVTVGDRCQPFELDPAVLVKLALQNPASGRAAQGFVSFIDAGQQLDVGWSVVAREAVPAGRFAWISPLAV
ncbi:MAG TPA: hypothetical protein VM578_00930 [Candidatus Saccharimonadales bacterium]|nr:hypothetical protein [Candidatus Saccharimonadales bacterium]